MTWHKDILEWRADKTVYMSIVFSWQLREAETRIRNRQFGEDRFVVGGPAVKFNPDYLSRIAETNGDISNMLQRHNPEATRTSTGCIRKCQFCAVPKIEGDLQELGEWPVLPVVCDNNLLACSRKHFDSVIDNLKRLEWCDFNQGLDARLLTQYHADRLAELKNPRIKLAWDHIKDEKYIIGAITKLRKAHISRASISCYVLIGFNDTPEDALYRLETLFHGLGINPNPMRYQPLTTVQTNEYVGPNWTNKELIRYMRYWSNLRYLGGVPFNEFDMPTITGAVNE